ncbi:hypothetical protein FHS10_001550 [Mucilaginibacter dorajii]|nr:hypothetical protein [Mucilaginibacter dorajii]
MESFTFKYSGIIGNCQFNLNFQSIFSFATVDI